MKELSIEEKAKRYDEAIEKFDVILNLNTVKESGTIFAEDVRKILPELKESEDEKVRRVLREIVLQWKNGHQAWCSDDKEIDTILAWLEKQGEQNPQIKLVFPKFRVGDIIQGIPLEKWDTTKKITHIDETGYYFDHSHQGDTVSGGFIGFLSENDYELVE